MKFLRIAPRGGFYSLGQLKKAGAEAGGGCIFVERTVKVGRGAVIIGPCFVSGGSELCPGCRVLPFSHIEDSVVGRGATVRASTLLGCTVGEDCSVGPYACLRGGAKAGAGCRIGDFVEIKNSVLGSGCRVAHHAYIGDADVKVIFGQTYELLSHAGAALVTSGTATLETALFRVPQVVCYHTPIGRVITFLKRHILKVKYISLVNLIAGCEVVRELVADTMTVAQIKTELGRILNDESWRREMLAGYDEVSKRLGEPGAPAKAARLIRSLLAKS